MLLTILMIIIRHLKFKETLFGKRIEGSKIEHNFYLIFHWRILQEKGLVTYFEDTWVSEKDRRRRHSIEKEIEIKESEFYKNNKPPPLFYGKHHIILRHELFNCYSSSCKSCEKSDLNIRGEIQILKIHFFNEI